ncbi:universal stress protein [Pseudomonadota bacterium]
MVIEQTNNKRFRILVCIDGSDESYQGLRYAAKMGGGVDADIVLLNIRPVDQGLHSGGMQVEVARENMLSWGLELPWIKNLRKGLDILTELRAVDTGWEEKSTQTSVEGDPLGDNTIEYTSESGKKIILKLKVASDIASGILDQWEIGQHDLIILGKNSRRSGMIPSFWDPAIAEKVAVHAPCSVLVARDLEVGHGHLICTDGSEKAMDMVRKDAYLASRCQCPISIISVSLDEEGEVEAGNNVTRARELIKSMGIEVQDIFTLVGDPVDQIIEIGCDYSLIVMSDSGTTGLKRFFMGSVAFKVLENAHNSVLIVR